MSDGVGNLGLPSLLLAALLLVAASWPGEVQAVNGQCTSPFVATGAITADSGLYQPGGTSGPTSFSTTGTATCFQRAWMKVSSSSIIACEVWLLLSARKAVWCFWASFARWTILRAIVRLLTPNRRSMRLMDTPETAKANTNKLMVI